MPPHIENNSTAPIMSGLQTVQMSVGCPYCTKNVQLSVIVHHPEDVKKEVTDNSTLIALRPPDKNEPSSNKLSQKDDNSLPVNNKSEPVQVPQIPIETGRVNVGPRLSESISSVVPQQPGMLLEEVPLSVVYSDTDADNNTNSAFKNEAQEMDSIVIKDEPQDDFPFQPSIPEEHFQSNLSQKSMLQHAVPEPIPRSSMRPLSITKTAGMRRPKPYMRKHKRPVSATQTISDIANAGQSQPLMSSLEFQGEPQFSDNQFEIHPDNPMTMTFHGSESMQQFGSEESSASGYNEQFQQNIEGDAATGFGDEDAGSVMECNVEGTLLGLKKAIKPTIECNVSDPEIEYHDTLDLNDHNKEEVTLILTDNEGVVNTDDQSNEEVKFKCNKCEFQSRYAQNLTRHEKEVHSSIDKKQCNVCSKTFKRAESCLIHEDSHITPSLMCDCCGEMFSTELTLQYHRRKVKEKIAHLGRPTENTILSCSICDKVFTQKANLSRHIANDHGEKKECHCDECNKVFSSPYKLSSHKTKCHNAKTFSCFCGKIYKTNYSLQRHLPKCVMHGPRMNMGDL